MAARVPATVTRLPMFGPLVPRAPSMTSQRSARYRLVHVPPVSSFAAGQGSFRPKPRRLRPPRVGSEALNTVFRSG